MKNLINNINFRRGEGNGWMIWGGIFVLVFGAIFLLAAFGGKKDGASGALLVDAVSALDWRKGVETAPVTLVEYGDYQCPACASYHTFVSRLIQESGDQLNFVYRHFPLRTIHKNADMAAWSAEAAGKQGKFWEMHDKLYVTQKDWEGSDEASKIFEGYATELGLDLALFKTDRDSAVIKGEVENDYQSGIRSQISGTPSFFVNGEMITNPFSYDEFKQLVFKSQVVTEPNPVPTTSSESVAPTPVSSGSPAPINSNPNPTPVTPTPVKPTPVVPTPVAPSVNPAR